MQLNTLHLTLLELANNDHQATLHLSKLETPLDGVAVGELVQLGMLAPIDGGEAWGLTETGGQALVDEGWL